MFANEDKIRPELQFDKISVEIQKNYQKNMCPYTFKLKEI